MIQPTDRRDDDTAEPPRRDERRGTDELSVVESVRRRVLIVDDEAAIVEVLSEHFKADYDVETALNGADALGAALRHRPDVVLLDLNMPRMNGVEVLRNLKQIDASIEVVMVSGNAEIRLTADALKNGAFGYVPKPFDLRYLDHMLAAIFDRVKAPKR